MSDKRTLVVISYYDRHPLGYLTALLRTLLQHSAGGAFDLLIVVNRTRQEQIFLAQEFRWIPVEYRPNLGMNIGAWDYGWRARPSYQEYLFLQDECYAIRDHWLAGFRAALANPRIGMVGESLNYGWDRPWDELKRRFADALMPGHFIEGEAASRVDCYLHFLREHAVNPGMTGSHLRSLVWFIPSHVLNEMNGFLIGRNYGECIAAEIAASKKVQSLGLEIAQVKKEEFFYFRHLEYNQDFPTAPYTHHANYVSTAAFRGILETRDREVRQMVRDKLQKWFRIRGSRASK